MGCTNASSFALRFAILIGLAALGPVQPSLGIPQAAGQSTNATPTGSSAHGPLDFVPCMFDKDEQMLMRTWPPRPVPAAIDDYTAIKLVQDTTAEITKAAGEYPPGYLREFQQAYLRSLEPKDLVNKTITEAYSKINQAIQSASKDEGVAGFGSRLGVTTEQHDTIDKAATAILENLSPVVLTTSRSLLGGQFKPPEDVSCSMSIMQWKETSDTFGRRVANSYVGIQVTVRNLNSKNEFLIHDVQIAVDTGMDPKDFGRFQAGRDKLLVRAVAQRGQSEDRRNLVLHALEAIGAIAGSSSIAGTTDFKSGVAVFQGAFIPGFQTLFPDHTVDQLNHINDLVFSASSTSKVIVPVQGSVPLVTFLAEKPIEQMPFAWCGYTKGKLGQTHWMFPRLQQQGTCPPESNSVTPEGAGGGTGAAAASAGGGGLPAASQPKSTIGNLDELHFKLWKPAALQALEQRTYVVIAGIHIQEVTGSTKLSNLDCSILPNGAVDISQTSDGVVTCSVTGSNLDKVASVVLEKEATKISGKIKAAKDGNSATIQFDPSVLSDADGVYGLYTVDNSGGETDSGLSGQLQRQPWVSKVEKSTVDLKGPTAVVTLDGKHLDLLDTVFLVPDNGSGGPVAGTIPKPAGASDTSVAIDFKTSDLKAGTDYHVRYAISKVVGKQADLKSITVKTGDAPPSVTVDKSSLTFAKQTQGTTSAEQDVALTNNGPTLLKGISISVTGTSKDDFIEENDTCGSTLAMGGKCSTSVTFKPTATGKREAVLSISDAAGDSLAKVSLSGTCEAPVGKKVAGASATPKK